MNASVLVDMKRRRFIQLICAVLYNCNIKGFDKGSIYQGNIKGMCVPGLNCYSCPGAIGACPLGSLQSALLSSKYKLPYYIIGVLLLFGIVLGRLICGFLCPFGFLQELLYKIPTKKLRKSRWTRALSYVKYVILVVFVIIIPLTLTLPGFCKFICPAGTIEGGIPLVLMNDKLRELVGRLFTWKIIIAAAIFIASVFIFRFFCRFICPLGAFYGLFHKVSLFGVKIDGDKCIRCHKCVSNCKMDIRNIGDSECIQCGECINICAVKAISFGYKNGKTSAQFKDDEINQQIKS